MKRVSLPAPDTRTEIVGIAAAVLGPLLLAFSLFPLLSWWPLLAVLGVETCAVVGIRPLIEILWYGALAYARDDGELPP